MVYFGLIYQPLQYCISCWGGAAPCNLEPLNVLNRRAIRIVCNAPRNEHTPPLFHELNILNFNDIYVMQIGKIMHKIFNNSWSGTYNFVKVSEVHSYQTRYSKKQNYYQESTELKRTDRALIIVGPKYGQIPDHIKSLPFHAFKLVYKKYLINNYLTA